MDVQAIFHVRYIGYGAHAAQELIYFMSQDRAAEGHSSVAGRDFQCTWMGDGAAQF